LHKRKRQAARLSVFVRITASAKKTRTWAVKERFSRRAISAICRFIPSGMTMLVVTVGFLIGITG
jgi:hypothetical protein